MNRLEENFGKWVVRQRWWIIGVTVMVLLLTGYGLRLLTFNRDLRVFFSKENPQLQALDALENTYGKTDNVSFALSPASGDVFTRETLAAVEELTEAAWQVPYSSRVDSLTNYQHTEAVEDDLTVEDLVRDAGNLSDEDLARIRKIALGEPQLVNLSLSPTGHVTEVNVTVLLPGKSEDEVTEVAEFARTLAADFRQKHPDIQLYASGSVLFDNAFGEISRDDMYRLVPLMGLILLGVIGFALRSVLGTIAAFLVVLASMITAMGLTGWLRISITTASALAPTIILTLAVADSIHILASMRHAMDAGMSRHEAAAESLRVNMRDEFLTAITTAIGFITMNFSDVPPFRDLGNIVAIGVVAAFLYAVLFLPALMAVLPIRVKVREEEGAGSLDRLADFVIRRRKTVFWCTLAGSVLLSLGMLRIELNDQFAKYFGKQYDIRRAIDFVETNLTGWDIIEYSVGSGAPGGIHDPAYLAKLEEFANWYRQQDKVIHVNTITNVIKRLNQNMNGNDESYYRIPEQRELAAQYMLLYRMSLPAGLDLNHQINVDESATRMIVTMRDATSRELRQMDEKARQWLAASAPASMYSYGSGLSMVWAHISERNIKSMLYSTLGGGVSISLVLIFALRSLKLGLVSMLPNVLPAFVAFGAWGYLAGQVGLGLSVVAAMTLGIVVDDTVHFVSKYLHARREEGKTAAEAVRYSYHTVGTAVWIINLSLAAGFLVLTLSGYKVSSEMGLLSALTIILAMFFDFLLTPSLLMNVEK
ncbi:MAG: MMPL family protein [Planctomycetes bacterium ADurb.Bin412]|nr:MAG: MMPL family protein [Planctomycetes bacterium ADurb.Bin412]